MDAKRSWARLAALLLAGVLLVASSLVPTAKAAGQWVHDFANLVSDVAEGQVNQLLDSLPTSYGVSFSILIYAEGDYDKVESAASEWAKSGPLMTLNTTEDLILVVSDEAKEPAAVRFYPEKNETKYFTEEFMGQLIDSASGWAGEGLDSFSQQAAATVLAHLANVASPLAPAPPGGETPAASPSEASSPASQAPVPSETAATPQPPAPAAGQHVVDEAGLLTGEQVAELERRAKEISERNKSEVLIHMRPSLLGSSPRQEAEELLSQRRKTNSAIIMVIVVDSRDLTFAATGQAFKSVGGEDGLEELYHEVKVPLKDNQWMAGSQVYLENADARLARFDENGKRIWQGKDYGLAAAISLALAAIVALIVTVVVTKRHKSARQLVSANDYVVDDTFQLKSHSDQFSHSTQTSRYVGNSNSSSGSSGSSSGSFSGKF